MAHAPDPNANPLDPFWVIVNQYRSLLVYIIGFGAGPWLVDWILAIGPPWPQSTAVSAFTSLVGMLVLIFSYSQWEQLRDIEYRSLLRYLVPVAFASLIIYIMFKGSSGGSVRGYELDESPW